MVKKILSILMTLIMTASIFLTETCTVLASDEREGLILQYKFDGDVKDSSASGKDGIIHDSSDARIIFVDEARFGSKVISFPGGSRQTYVQIPGDAFDGLTSITVTSWIYLPTATAGWHRLFDFGQNTTYYMFCAPRINTGNTGYSVKITENSNGNEYGPNSPAVGYGAWHHLAVVLDAGANTITTYLDGVQAGSSSAGGLNISSVLSDNPENNKLYIGKSQWPDPYFTGKMYDFRVYSRPLSADEIKTIYYNSFTDESLAKEDLWYISIPTSDVTSDIVLPTVGSPNGSTITWSSDNKDVISDTGVVTRPKAGQPDATVKLTATASKNGAIATREFIVTVLAYPSDETALAADKAWLEIPNANAIMNSITLPTVGPQGSSITWESSNPEVLSSTGEIKASVTQPVKLTLTATLTKGTLTDVKVFEVTVIPRRFVGEGVNIAALATPVASYTASPSVVTMVNNGSRASTSSASECWETWNSGEDPVTIYYQWDTPMLLSSMDVCWWYDQTNPSVGGVQLPTKCTVQYWNGSDWVNVTNMADENGTQVETVGLKGNGLHMNNTVFNGVTFDPVLTTRLRLTIYQNKSQVNSTGIGIQEWRVYTNDPATLVFSNISFIDPQWTTKDLTLPREINGYTISWKSDNPDVISDEGIVNRPEEDEPSVTVTLTATAYKEGESALTKDFQFTVLPKGFAGRTLELDLKNLGIEISPTLYGIFFEDIDHALDGGLNANLIDNGSFQQYNWPTALPSSVYNRGPNNDRYSLNPREIYSWTALAKGGAAGTATITDKKPMNANNNYCVEINITNSGSGDVAGYGIAANGYSNKATNVTTPSMPIKAGVSYDLSLYLQGETYSGKIKVFLENASGELNSNVLVFEGLSGEWQKFEGQLTALRTEDNRMMVMGDAEGTFYIDYVMLYPEKSELWRDGAAGGLRKDLAQAIADLSPKFMRFPGGCCSEGKSQDRLYRWKDTVGPREERRQMPNYWGYWSSNEIGFYEYFCLAEELGATPLPVVGLGLTCPFHRGSNYYEAPIGEPGSAEREEYMRTYVQDALDLIEFCNGGTDTVWGKLRADMGHPEPFNLEYISIGNENWGDSFWERFDIMYNAIKAKYPDIKIISTSGPYASGSEFNANYRQIDSKYQDTIVDEHYYMSSSWFLNNINRYNPGSVRGNQGNTYDRNKPTRVFVGEYSDNTSENHYMSALYEAAFTTALERNSDMVLMASYAPLFCKKGMYNWGANLIWFDNRGLWRSCNYYYQWIFANHVGNRVVPDEFYTYDDPKADKDVYTAPSIDTESGDIYIKIVNTEPNDKEFRIKLNNNDNAVRIGSYIYMESDNLMVRNQNSTDYSEKVKPVTLELGEVGDNVFITVPGYSVGAVVLKASETQDKDDFEVDVEFNLDKLEPNKDLQAKIKVRNKGDKEEPVLTIIALFNSENKMLNFSYLSKVIRIGTDEELSAGFSLSPDIKDNSGNEVRVFVWKGEDLESSSMVPLSNVIILK